MQERDRQPGWHLAKQALSHPERFEMLTRITQKGSGAGAVELAEALGLSVGKAKYHLLVLSRANLIAETSEARERYIAVLCP